MKIVFLIFISFLFLSGAINAQEVKKEGNGQMVDTTLSIAKPIAIGDTNSIAKPIAIGDTNSLAPLVVPIAQTPEQIQAQKDANIDSLLVSRQQKKDAKVRQDKLVTYFFNDSIRKQRIFTWTVNPYLNAPTMGVVDTLLSGNRTELPFYKQDVGVTYLGVTGSASVLHNYFKRKENRIFSFFDPYTIYTNQPDEVKYYSTKGPYTELHYHTSGAKKVAEDNLSIVFARNINPEWNFGLAYDKLGAKGHLFNQATNVKSFTLFTSYTGKRYVAHAAYIYNGIRNRENGGIANDFFQTDTILNPGEIETKLKTARNRYSSNTFTLTHSYGIPLGFFKKTNDSLTVDAGTMVYLGHSFEYTNYKRVYTDGVQDTSYLDFTISPDIPLHYYTASYFSRTRSYDSSSASQMDNKLFVRLQPYSASSILSKIDAGLGASSEHYYSFNPKDYISQPAGSTGYNAVYVYGNGTGMLGKYFEWNTFLKYTLSAYQFNDLYLDANARVSLYPISGGIHFLGRFIVENRSPTFHQQNYVSNHVKWDTQFDKTTENKIELDLAIPLWKLNLGFRNSILSKAIYFDLDAKPKQAADVVNITALTVDKLLQWRKLHLDTRFLFQVSSNTDVMPLPGVSFNTALYFETDWVKSVLRNQIGLDVYYNTRFYDYAYNPASGMFHTQNTTKTGGYPWIDLFANFKWKRATIYVKFTNVANGMIGNRDHFSALHYPRNPRMLRWGLNWIFYN